MGTDSPIGDRPPPAGIRLFLVERYTPSMTAQQVALAVNGLRRLEAADGGHLWTVLIAAEDTCLSLFSGASAAAVAKANGQAGFAFSRIVETLAFPG